LGKVKDLRKTFNIPDSYADDSIIYKYGYTSDLAGRANDHKNDFQKFDNINVNLSLFEIVDPSSLSKIEIDLENYFKSKNSHFSCTDSLGNNRTELVIFNKSKFNDVKKEYSRLGSLYANTVKAKELLTSEITVQLNKALAEIRILEREIEHLEINYSTNLKLIEEEYKNKLKDEQQKTKDEQHKYEILLLKFEMFKLKHQ
jgi:hypothetical protein